MAAKPLKKKCLKLAQNPFFCSGCSIEILIFRAPLSLIHAGCTLILWLLEVNPKVGGVIAGLGELAGFLFAFVVDYLAVHS